ncbi:MAG: von Willebrand factor type A domain-containing protein [Gemmatimonadetes bacterium]|nr:von Willebrand factor type A domain-containing protein [Gemmatimonadota bacterium]
MTIVRNAATAALTLLFLGLAGTAHAQEQTGTIAGVVTDAANGQTIESALVTLDGAETGVLTNLQGRYVLTGVPVGEHTVNVTILGYEEQQVQVTVAAGQTAVVNIALTAAALNIQNLEVTGVARAAARVKLPFTVSGFHPYNTESYAEINENDFRTVTDAPLSTFSIDVDRASYANVRRFIQDGQRPPVDAVRIEEMINYFPYQWGDVAGEHPFAVTTEVTQAPWKREHRLVRIGLHAESIDTEDLPPNNLVFLLDVSGSMSSQDKLPLLKKAFALLVDQLREQDRVAIVVYAGAAGLVLPSTPGSEKDEILAALEKLNAGGSTAGGAGIKLAYDVARKYRIDGGNNRVILATDGDFNVGASSDDAMVKLIEKERESGTFLSVLGFGTGNLKDSKMEQIADHGNGNFAYIDGLLEARKVLVEEMGGTLLTLAKDVKLQVEFNPATVSGYRLIGYENRLLADEDFNDDTKDAGELGAGHTVTALYEVVPAGVAMPRPSVDPLRYQEEQPAENDAPPPTPTRFGDELVFVKVRYKDPDGDTSKLLEHPVMDRTGMASADLRFAAAVAGFGMLLRESEHAGTLTLDDIVSLAEQGRGDDPRGYRGEFIRLVEASRDLKLLEMEAEEFRPDRRR